MSDPFDVPPPPVPHPLPPTSGDGRRPPPWEGAAPGVQRFIDTARSVLTEPVPFFRSMKREGGLGAPLAFALIGILIGAIGTYLVQLLSPFGSGSMFGDRTAGGFVATVILLPAFSVVGLFIGAGILHVLLLLVAGTRQPFETTVRVVAYTVGSTSLFNIVPIIGGLVAALWSLVVLILGTAEAHEVSQAQAAIAVLLPAVVCCGLAVLFGGAMLALLFGALAAGFAS